LKELKETDWASRLQHALSHAQNFDFVAARNVLTGGTAAQDTN
jgi:hypothetical protein